MEKLQLTNTEKEINFNDLEKNAFIDHKVRIDRQPIALSVGEYFYAGNHYPIAFGSYGEFSCIVGASKSKKTFFKSALIASYIGGQSVSYFSNIRGHDTQNKYVLDIDTEQSKFHTQRVAKRVCSMVGADYEFYKPYSLRQYDTSVRLEFIEWLLFESEYKKQIGLLSIDGVADLVENVNDLDKSNLVVQKLMKWSTKANCHILTVLHRNHNTMKPTGHLGSAILKKSETVAFVEKIDHNVKVSAEYSRNIAFDDIIFTINTEFLPIEVDQVNNSIFTQ